jgi:hypothetical protein
MFIKDTKTPSKQINPEWSSKDFLAAGEQLQNKILAKIPHTQSEIY